MGVSGSIGGWSLLESGEGVLLDLGIGLRLRKEAITDVNQWKLCRESELTSRPAP